MPASYPDFPHHTQIAAYFDAYVDHFGFRDRITFETRVTPGRAARRRRLGRRPPTTATTRAYDALVVANGHHWDPRWPEPAFPGQDRFAGVQLHSHDYTRRRPGAVPRQAGRRARHGQLGDGHRGRVVVLRRATSSSPRGAARG